MNILLVEDDAMLAATIRERARQEGLALDHAGDAEGAPCPARQRIRRTCWRLTAHWPPA